MRHTSHLSIMPAAKTFAALDLATDSAQYFCSFIQRAVAAKLWIMKRVTTFADYATTIKTLNSLSWFDFHQPTPTPICGIMVFAETLTPLRATAYSTSSLLLGWDSMQKSVLALVGTQFKIFKSVIRRVAVNVMNHFSAHKRPTQMFRHDVSCPGNLPAPASIWMPAHIKKNSSHKRKNIDACPM